jgi:hypothetical protein
MVAGLAYDLGPVAPYLLATLAALTAAGLLRRPVTAALAEPPLEVASPRS